MIAGKTIAVWFSCGAASAIAAKKTIEIYGSDNNVLIVNNPVMNEHPDNLRFLKDCEQWFGRKIIEATNPKYPNCDIREVFDDRKYMGGINGAPCTMELKKMARYEFEVNNKIDYHVLGFTYDEKNRVERFVKYERSNLIPILIDLQIRKVDCFWLLQDAGIKIPEIYNLGFANANCIGCVKASSPTYWNLVRKLFPDVFEERLQQSRDIGAKLVKRKGKRIYLHELKESDRGGKIKNWECGIFCNDY